VPSLKPREYLPWIPLNFFPRNLRVPSFLRRRKVKERRKEKEKRKRVVRIPEVRLRREGKNVAVSEKNKRRVFSSLGSLPPQQLQVLLNSLFKVLCNFPSRYLLAIELPLEYLALDGIYHPD